MRQYFCTIDQISNNYNKSPEKKKHIKLKKVLHVRTVQCAVLNLTFDKKNSYQDHVPGIHIEPVRQCVGNIPLLEATEKYIVNTNRIQWTRFVPVISNQT